jgi:serine/threonine protein kinase
MELVEGNDLQSEMQKTTTYKSARPHSLDIADMRRINLPAFAGTSVIHRDIKPANIRIDAEGKAFLVDYGFSQAVVSKTKTNNKPTCLARSLSGI